MKISLAGVKSFSLVLPVLLLSGCVMQQQQQPDNVALLQAQIQTQNQTIEDLNSQLASVQPAQADAWLQLQALRQEIALLRGNINDIELKLANYEGLENVDEEIAKHDRALRLAEAQLALELQLDEPVSKDDAGNILPVTSSSTALASLVSEANKEITQQAQPQPTPAQTVADKETSQALYDSGIKAFNDRKYEQAVNAFTDFANIYPTNSLVSNSYFWQGESYYQLKDYASAALAYEVVISKYPKSNKAPSAYLKQGLCFKALNKPDAAKERYNQLIETYPKAPEATRAKQLLQAL